MDAPVYQYPPELFDLLGNTMPRLCRAKRDVITFFEGAGVPQKHLSDLRAALAKNKDSVNKFDLVRRVLERINRDGDAGLRYRREVLKRVIEFEDFSRCWPMDLLEAKRSRR